MSSHRTTAFNCRNWAGYRHPIDWRACPVCDTRTKRLRPPIFVRIGIIMLFVALAVFGLIRLSLWVLFELPPLVRDAMPT